MDWTKERLTSAHIRTLILKTLPTEYAAPVEEVIAFAVRSYKELDPEGTLLTYRDLEYLTPLFQNALSHLEERGFVEDVGGWWQSLTSPERLEEIVARDPEEVEARAVANAKVFMGGEEEEAVYGWYLPESRDLAALKGEERFPMKVGTSRTGPYKRLKSHIGTAPAVPILDFVFQIDDGKKMGAQNTPGIEAARAAHAPRRWAMNGFGRTRTSCGKSSCSSPTNTRRRISSRPRRRASYESERTRKSVLPRDFLD